MSRTGYNGHQQYFGFRPVLRHLQTGCAGRVEASLHRDESFDGDVRSTTIRLLCLDCGAVTLVDFKGDVDTEHTYAEAIGYGSKPDKVLGLFLWPTAPIWDRDERGPTAFYVTRSPARPDKPADAIGAVSWNLGSRGGLQWHAGVGVGDWGGCQRSASQTFSSRRAAVAWLADETSVADVEPAQ